MSDEEFIKLTEDLDQLKTAKPGTKEWELFNEKFDLLTELLILEHIDRSRILGIDNYNIFNSSDDSFA